MTASDIRSEAIAAGFSQPQAARLAARMEELRSLVVDGLLDFDVGVLLAHALVVAIRLEALNELLANVVEGAVN